MKGLIIENQYGVDVQIRAFLADNPDLFDSVKEIINARSYDTEELLPDILSTDAIIIASTWTDHNQLIEFMEAFTNPDFPKPLNFYLGGGIVSTLNEWLNGESWQREPKLAELAIKLIKSKHTLYDFSESDEYVTDDLNPFNKIDWKRNKYKPHKMFYDDDKKLFYADGGTYDLNYVLYTQKRKNKFD